MAKDDEKSVFELVQNQTDNINHTKVFNYLYETIRGLLIYAKEGDYDKLFISENLVEILGQLITNCYVQDYKVLLGLTSNMVNGKVISNDDKIVELMNYLIGSIKCFTQTNKEVQKMTVQN